jgi:hypothetical protein
MQPIEHLRHVARVEGADPAMLAREAAFALDAVAGTDPAGLVPSCRRLIERHVTNGPLWWLSARVLSSPEQGETARESAAALEADPTDRRLANALPDDTSVLVVGWPDIAAEALRRRGDLELLIVESGGEGDALARRLGRDGAEVSPVPDRGVGAAATVAGLVIVEALAAGPSGILAASGSLAAAAVAAQAGVPVWAVVGVGRALPDALWAALLSRFDDTGLEPWDRNGELVAASLIDSVVGPDGPGNPIDGLATTTCPVAPELLRPTV